MTFKQFESELLDIVGVGFDVIVHSNFQNKVIVVKLEYNAVYIGRSSTMFSAYYDVFLMLQRSKDFENVDFSSLGKYFQHFNTTNELL